MMERLTDKHWRNLDPWECCGQDNYCQRGCHEEGGCTKGCIVPKLYVRLAYYEDLEEQGRLVTLPCKVGDVVYIPDSEYEEWIDEYEVKYFYCSSAGINRIYAVCGTLSRNFRPHHIGKTVFLTREEAEAALAEKTYKQVQDAIDQHNRQAMDKIAAFIEPKEGADDVE